jgi:hypothetical protein
VREYPKRYWHWAISRATWWGKGLAIGGPIAGVLVVGAALAGGSDEPPQVAQAGREPSPTRAAPTVRPTNTTAPASSTALPLERRETATAVPLVPSSTPPPPATSTPPPPAPTSAPTNPPPAPTQPPPSQGQTYPPGDAFNCSDFTTYAQAKAYLDAVPGDPSKLDQDKDGIPCESLPGAP